MFEPSRYRRRRLILALAGAASFGAAAALLVALATRERAPAQAPAAASPSSSAASADGEEIARLRQELARVQASVQRLSPEGVEIARLGAKQGPPEAATLTSPTQVPSRAEQLGKIEAAFAHESDDPRWDPEADLHARLGEILPAGSTLRSLDCRSSMCRWEAEYADMESYQEFADDFLLAQTTRPWPGASTFDVRAAPDGQEVVVLSYLHRNPR